MEICSGLACCWLIWIEELLAQLEFEIWSHGKPWVSTMEA